MAFALTIFDCDGVLIDSEIIACRVHAAELTRHGIAMTAEQVMDRFLGFSQKRMHEVMEAEAGLSLPDSFAATYAVALRAAFEADLEAMPGIVEALDMLGTPACVASSSSHERLRLTLGLTGLYDRFAPNVFSSSDVANGKPAPDLFLHAAGRMGAAPADCLVVEDSVSGVTAAVAAGMMPIGFIGGRHCRPGHAEKLTAAGAARIVADIREIPRIAS